MQTNTLKMYFPHLSHMLIYLVILLHKINVGMILYLLYLRLIILFSVISYHVNLGPGCSSNTILHSLMFAHFSPSKCSFGLAVGQCVINHCCKMCFIFNALLSSCCRSYKSESVNSCPTLLKLMFWAQTTEITFMGGKKSPKV